MARRTVRTWHTVVGFATPQDLKALQASVQNYHEQLLVALTNLQQSGQALPATGNFTQAAWDAMTTREEAFLAISSNELNPLAWLDASTGYAQGQSLVTELDSWRDQLEALKAPGVPSAPLPVPASQTGFLSDIGTGLALVLGILLLREFGSRR